MRRWALRAMYAVFAWLGIGFVMLAAAMWVLG